MTRLLPTSPLLLLVFLLGCSQPVAYQPDDGTIDGMTRDQREQLFAESLSRALKPRIYQVWIDDASYGYDSQIPVRDGFGIPMGYTGRRRVVYFANVRELRLYDNNAVFVFDMSGRLVDKLQFGYPDDARRMIDLIASYRARRYAAAPEDEPPPRRRYQQPPLPGDPSYDEPRREYDRGGPPDDRWDDRPPPPY